MNIQEALQLYPRDWPLRREMWNAETFITPWADGSITYRKFKTGQGWEWIPTAEDLAANDWTGAK